MARPPTPHRPLNLARPAAHPASSRRPQVPASRLRRMPGHGGWAARAREQASEACRRTARRCCDLRSCRVPPLTSVLICPRQNPRSRLPTPAACARELLAAADPPCACRCSHALVPYAAPRRAALGPPSQQRITHKRPATPPADEEEEEASTAAEELAGRWLAVPLLLDSALCPVLSTAPHLPSWAI